MKLTGIKKRAALQRIARNRRRIERDMRKKRRRERISNAPLNNGLAEALCNLHI